MLSRLACVERATQRVISVRVCINKGEDAACGSQVHSVTRYYVELVKLESIKQILQNQKCYR